MFSRLDEISPLTILYYHSDATGFLCSNLTLSAKDLRDNFLSSEKISFNMPILTPKLSKLLKMLIKVKHTEEFQVEESHKTPNSQRF